MIQINYDDLVNRIKERTGLSSEEIEERVNRKLDELSGLISKEGAAHIVANELKVKIFEDVKGIKIKDVLVGMNGVEMVCKVMRMDGVRVFKNSDREGKVCSFLVGDDTGCIRVVLWDNSLINMVENNEIKEGDVIKIKNGYVRSNNGFKELHLNNKSEIEKSDEEVKVDLVVNDYVRKQLKDLKEGDNNIGVLGTIVQVFEPRFYEVCGICGARLRLVGDKFICEEHKNGDRKLVPVLSLIFDDGTDNIRAVAFRDVVGKVLGVGDEKILELRSDMSKFEDMRNGVLGNQVIIVGRVNKNEMFNRLEFVINRVEDVDVDSVIKELGAV